MKKLNICIILLCTVFFSCTKDNTIDSGISNGTMPDKTIYQYMQGDTYNWDLTIQMIDHAGLTSLFKGEDSSHPKIMVLGLTSHSIRRWVYTKGKTEVTQMDPLECRRILLNHVFDQVYFRKDIPSRETGGVALKSIGGAEIRLFTEEQVDPTYGIGPVLVKFTSKDGTSVVNAQIASADINPKNGVVHSMHYNYIIDALK
ncbi:fasciclin domain-containing protein [Pedobacter sp. MW01-1-1]|uniref:fasciclin domain-containing protein n=1 Tax=Pedobacter sp. MW01-1-1 TaxID=3383027 RepID=UPI003FEDC969